MGFTHRELRRRRTSGRLLRIPNDILIEPGESRFDASGDVSDARKLDSRRPEKLRTLTGQFAQPGAIR